MKQTLTVLLSMMSLARLNAQLPTSQTPQPSSFQPVMPQGSYSQPSYQYQQPGQIQMGSTAQDVINQVNRSAGIPYGTSNDPRRNQQIQQQMIMDRMHNDPAYNPALRNPNSSQYHLTPSDEVKRLVSDGLHTGNPAQTIQKLKSGYYKSPDFAKETKSYNDALQHLRNMLQGKEKLSVANAYFEVENAYGSPYLSKRQYDDLLNQSAAHIKKWMAENGVDPGDNEGINLAIQKFMGEKTFVSTGVVKLPGDNNIYKLTSTTHQPFYYDFDDYQGEKDFRNYFITKCLATGSGQCSSMPAVYLALAERLGAKAYMTLTPQHSSIKYPDKAGNINNYEPTTHWKISDTWYIDNMALLPEAVRSGVYLDTLNSRAIVADCMMNLANGYMTKFGGADAAFVADCLEAAAPEFRKPNLQFNFVKSSMLARMLSTVVYDEGIRNYDDIPKSKEAAGIYKALEENEAVIKRLGYRNEPKELYAQLIKESEFKGKMQQSKGLNGKKKREMFIKNR